MVLHTFCSAACPQVTFVRVHTTVFHVCVCVMCQHDDGFNRRGEAVKKKKKKIQIQDAAVCIEQLQLSEQGG